MKKILLATMLVGLLLACSGKRQVTRLDTDTTIDLSGKWNDADARMVAEELVADCLARPWLRNFTEANGREPVVTVGRIRNKTSEHINMETYTKDFERELINSARVRFVANKFEREDVRDERLDQDEWASAETKKRLKDELGADFILLGSIKSIVDQYENKQVVFYQTDLELVNIETNEKAWIGSNKIKKGISQGKTKW